MTASPLFEAAWKLQALTAQDPSLPPETPDPNTVTPGVIGFAVMALIGIAAVLLAFDMNRRVRRINYRQQARDKILAELAEQGESSENDK
ncbi:hypothetical protein [uncultured Agrococcus sp.]|uniref:hypothetical protein n=1 Tax=uncultured Agrococcus sp. TaxID=382258 RepID=UPI0025FFEC71|nr:hypothetical protein [uncultured Agrococcus sp.]